jgi:guanylate kinase
MSGKMIVICAPSGTGKSTLISKLKHDHPDLEWSVSCTTRAIRSGEVNGREYHFLSVEDFERQIQQDQFIEWARVHSNYYGTSRIFVDAGIKAGVRMLFDLDVQGADAMKKIYGDQAQVIFIEPPSIDELKKRLNNRGTDKPEVIRERIENAQRELARKNDYDYLIMNDDVDRAYQSLKSVVERILK